MAEEKKKGSGIKRYVVSFVNVKAWMTYDTVKKNVGDIKDSVASTFEVKKEAQYKATFDEAMKRYGLSEEDVEKQKMAFLEIAVFVSALGIGMFAYALYLLLVHTSITGSIIAFSLTAVIFATAFRFHFQYYQFKRRKLGCTFKEWKRDFFSRG